MTKKAQSNKKFEVTLSSDKLNHCRLFFSSSSWNHHSLLVSLLFASKLPNFSLLWVRIEVSSFWRISSPKFMAQILINFRSQSILDLNQLRRSKSIFFGAWETSLLVYPNSCKSLLLFWYSRSYLTIVDLHRLLCRS